MRAGHLVANPCEGRRLPAPDAGKDNATFLTPEEFAVLRDAMTERWRPMTTFLVSTGMRYSEAAALTVGDIDPDAGTVRITTRPGSTPATTPAASGRRSPVRVCGPSTFRRRRSPRPETLTALTMRSCSPRSRATQSRRSSTTTRRGGRRSRRSRGSSAARLRRRTICGTPAPPG
ncbi:tyrosine-type recombinase/integrase [Rhodococcus hoagii]|uniref:Tyrosine-type recombinase/integrase n=1 Tax=Rhodococcus hoagii TaxID=43767 RepID=A0A9Q2PQJ2_RHOHA|nr:tyrosine-type recombinase/integrase [Prescottella equi]